MASFLILMVVVVLTASGHLLMKLGMNRVGEVNGERLRDPLRLAMDLATTWPIAAGILVYAVSLSVWLVALSRVKLGVAYPVLALLYVVLPFASWLLLSERMTPMHVAGMFLIVIGVGLVAKAGLG